MGSLPKLKFHDVDLELSSLPGIEFSPDGSMVLRFDGYTGTITLRSLNKAATPSAAASTAATSGEKGDSSSLSGSGSRGEGREEKEAVVPPTAASSSAPPANVAATTITSPTCAATTSSTTTMVTPGHEDGAAASIVPPPIAKATEGTASSSGKQGNKKRRGAGKDAEGKDDDGDRAEEGDEQEEQQQEEHKSSRVSVDKSGSSSKKAPRRNVKGDSPGSVSSRTSGKDTSTKRRDSKGTPRTSNSRSAREEEDDDDVMPTASSQAEPKPSSSSSSSSSSCSAIPGVECAPVGRWGHSANLVGPCDRMLVYGGVGDDDQHTLGDLFVYECGSDRWVKPVNCEDSLRAWHSATYIPHKNLLIAFGGERQGVSGATTAEVVEEVRALDSEILLWYPPAVSGKPPTARAGHSASLMGNDIILFGGSRGRKWQSSVVVLDTDRWVWRTPNVSGDAPEGRSYHSAVVVGSNVVMFGGNNGQRCFNGVHVLRCGKTPWEWFHPEVVGQAPPERRTGQCATVLGDGKTILIHGGWDPQDETQPDTKYFKDAFLLDTASWEWLPAPSTVSDKLGYLTGHTAVWVEGTQDVVVFGGQDASGARRAEVAKLHLPPPYNSNSSMEVDSN